MGKIITVTSGKGGTGKTTTAAALASCLAALEHKTLCIDFDAQLRNLDIALAMTDFTVMDFSDVASGKYALSDACSESPMISNLFFLSAPVHEIPERIDYEAISEMFDKIRSEFDYCIIDTPAGIGRGFRLANKNADMSIVVTTGDFSAMRDASRAADALRELGVKQLRLIVNRVIPKSFKQIKITVDDIIDITGVRLLAIVPEDSYVFAALHAGTPLILYKKRNSAYDFLDAARRLTGEDIPLKKVK
ncbi:MAG: AAA family ATPase [Oscillospiraceae bacterium]|nr:AAA family ATPase [Oscillospiraceae bacterium]MCL2278820.1 AAA family ATPase [Oscillospiraceae bacterium]